MKRLDCLVVREYEAKDGTKKKSWTKIGVAFEGRDGGYNLTLDALPIDGRIIMREPRQDDARGPQRRPAAEPGPAVDPGTDDIPF